MYIKAVAALLIGVCLFLYSSNLSVAQDDPPQSVPDATSMPLAPVGTPICGPVQNMSGAIATNTTWQAGKVYVVTGSITVNQLTTLTIQPGAVVKLNSGKGFVVNGRLIAEGTTNNPVYFTSIRDDSICGDTNGDTTASVPNTGDWSWIDFTKLGDQDSRIRYAVIRYGGRAYDGWGSSIWRSPIRFFMAVPKLENITFEKNYRNAAQIIGGNWLTNSLKSSNVIHTLYDDHLSVPQANTFTIPPGFLFKPERGHSIYVSGKLTATGTPDQPIVITSMSDDSTCGVGAAGEPICDTNNDTTASVPNTGEWGWIEFSEMSDPQSEISRVVLQYGGRQFDGWGSSIWRAPIRFYRSVPNLDYVSFKKNYLNGASIIGGDWLTTALKSKTVVHYMEGYLNILQVNTLTIPQGVKIKLSVNTGILVNGRLDARGTEELPIFFTSLKDDDVCGTGAANELVCDTNNDGLASVPASGDWSFIEIYDVSDPSTTIDHAYFRYGGRFKDGWGGSHWRAVLRIYGVNPTVSNTAFTVNHTGIDLISGARPTLICNDFEGNTSPYAIWADTPATVNATDNWWGSVSGPTHATNPHGKGDKVTNGVEFTPWRTTPCNLPPSPPEAAFEAIPTSGEAPLAVQFFNTSDGAVTNSQWAFGDGGTSNVLNPTHVYTRPGLYSVTLMVTGPAGNDTVTATSYIKVNSTVYRMFTPVVIRPRR